MGHSRPARQHFLQCWPSDPLAVASSHHPLSTALRGDPSISGGVEPAYASAKCRSGVVIAPPPKGAPGVPQRSATVESQGKVGRNRSNWMMSGPKSSGQNRPKDRRHRQIALNVGQIRASLGRTRSQRFGRLWASVRRYQARVGGSRPGFVEIGQVPPAATECQPDSRKLGILAKIGLRRQNLRGHHQAMQCVSDLWACMVLRAQQSCNRRCVCSKR